VLESRCRELQKQCDGYKEILEKDVKLFSPQTLEDLKGQSALQNTKQLLD